jgi:hypothetical protein
MKLTSQMLSATCLIPVLASEDHTEIAFLAVEADAPARGHGGLFMTWQVPVSSRIVQERSVPPRLSPQIAARVTDSASTIV